MRAQLIPLDGGDPVVLTRDVTLVGRKRNLCDLYLDRKSVSKLHCLIVKTDGLLFIRDLGSTNGTRVNGQRVTRGALLPGDELSFAGVRFRVHLGPGEPEPGPEEKTEIMSSFHRPERFDEPNGEAEPGLGSDSDVRLLPDDSEA